VRTAGEYRLLEELASETKSAVPLIKKFSKSGFHFPATKNKRTINMIADPETLHLSHHPSSTFFAFLPA
jgi:hypothetical protein